MLKDKHNVVGGSIVNKEFLLNELCFLKGNVSQYILMYEEELAEWTPHKGLRNLYSLVNHICGIPSIAVAILEQQSDEDIFKLDEPVKLNNLTILHNFFLGGFEQLETVVKTIPTEQFYGKLIHNPFGEKVTSAKVIVDAITHLYHHRGQLHNYLKVLGYPISTETLFLRNS